jgi:aminopeptidase N
MKLQNIILGVVVLFLCSCSKTTEDSRFYDEGVSWDLARHRKATIQDLKYNLRFKIPADKEQDIQGLDTICFQLKEAQEVVLDFREDPQKIKTVQINGKVVDCKIEKEHSILPEEHLQQGQNQIVIVFIVGNQSLNRNEDYMYTLFVPDRARTAFPCMEQPNLKALFTLILEIPVEWEAVTNTYCQEIDTLENSKVMHFAQTEPLSTYLFAFAAGKFSHYTYTEDGRTIGAYCRETDPKRIAQLPTIFQQVLYSLKWQEDFT